MGFLPHGMVTFLFTDIEGSTRLWEQHPEAMGEALARHDALLRLAIEAHAGYVFKLMGDAFCAAFYTAPEALHAALDAQRALHAEPWGQTGAITVRMALHTGVTEQRAGDYVGPVLNRISRLLSAGHGGQVLLSAATQELVRDDLPPGVALRDMGQRRLRDLTRAEQVYQVLAPGLPSSFPPLKTLDARRVSLPVQPTPLIGRERELAQLTSLLCQPAVRLVTLTGPGGMGKTRLALQVAAELLDAFEDGVCFVDLAPISDPQLVISSIAQVLELKEAGQTPLLQSLRAYLRPRRLLLLLDNLEQVLEAAPLVSELLRSAPGLKVLATSRVVLKLRGEKEFSVPPLALPDPRRLPPLAQLARIEAVRLFLERARDVHPDLQLTSATAPAIAQICQRLDGLPLAIELAAARTRVLPPEQLLQRLDQRLRVLTGGPRDLPQRQQTLRNTIDWSYSLLGEAEQRLFRRLGVFVGGCSLQAAEVVCQAEAELGLDSMDGLAALVEQSLLRQQELGPGAQAEPRFLMFETIREYALAQLELAGEAELLQWRHVRWCVDFAGQVERGLDGPQQQLWQKRLDAEYDNLRAGLQWLLAHQQHQLGLRLGAALSNFWLLHGRLREGRGLLEQLLVQTQAPSPQLAVLLCNLGDFAVHQHDYPAARRYLEQALALSEGLGDKAGVARTLLILGLLAYYQVDHAQARLQFEQSLALCRELGAPRGIADALHHLGHLAMDQSDYAKAERLFSESEALFAQLDHRTDISRLRKDLGRIAVQLGEYARAAALYAEALGLLREADDIQGIVLTLIDLGELARIQGHYEQGLLLYEESLELAMQIGNRGYVADTLRGMADLYYEQDVLPQAATLYQQSLAHYRELESTWGMAWVLYGLGRTAVVTGALQQARAAFVESLQLQSELQEQRLIAACLEGLAAIAGAEGLPERGAWLLGAAQAIVDRLGLRRFPADERGHLRQLEALRSQLGEDAFAAAWSAGQAVGLEQALARAQE